MRTSLKIGIGIIFTILLLLIGFQGLKYYTKLASPEMRVSGTYQNATIHIQYCSPSKRGRAVFGELVPYNTVWRTGANEPTTFSCTGPIRFFNPKDSSTLEIQAGKYSIWTIPDADTWTIIWNSEVPDWGVNWDSKPTHNPEKDVYTLKVEALKTAYISENFTIQLNDNLEFRWDDVLVKLPIVND